MEYPTNSHRVKAEQAQEQASTKERREIKPVVTGATQAKSKNGIGKWVDLFIKQDIPKIKAYVFRDVFLPALKKALMGSIDMSFPGGSGSGYNSDYSSKPKIRYSGFAEEPNYRKATGTVVARDNVEYADIEFPNRGAAERVLLSMRDIHAEFQSVTLAEMYELSGLEHPYTYTKYGWKNLRDAEVMRRGDAYFIKLPQATLLTNK